MVWLVVAGTFAFGYSGVPSAPMAPVAVAAPAAVVAAPAPIAAPHVARTAPVTSSPGVASMPRVAPTPWNPPLLICPSPLGPDEAVNTGTLICSKEHVYAFAAPPGWEWGDPIPAWKSAP